MSPRNIISGLVSATAAFIRTRQCFPDIILETLSWWDPELRSIKATRLSDSHTECKCSYRPFELSVSCPGVSVWKFKVSLSSVKTQGLPGIVKQTWEDVNKGLDDFVEENSGEEAVVELGMEELRVLARWKYGRDL